MFEKKRRREAKLRKQKRKEMKERAQRNPIYFILFVCWGEGAQIRLCNT